MAKMNEFDGQCSFSVISMVWSNVLNQIAVLNDCSKEFNEFNRLIFVISQVSIKLCMLVNVSKNVLIFSITESLLNWISVT